MFLNENHVVAKVYPSYKNMTLVQGLSSREHCKSVYNYITQVKLIIISGGETENWVGIINSTYRFFSCSPYSGMICRSERWILNHCIFFNFFHFLFYTKFCNRYKAEMKLGRKRRVVQFKRQHELEEKIGGHSKNVILLFLYIVTVVKSCISTRTKQFSGIQMTMLKSLLCFSFGRCSSPPQHLQT